MSELTNKHVVYEALKSGRLGNTNPMWESIDEWKEWDSKNDYPLYGVRAYVPGDKRTKLNIPREEVEQYVKENFKDGKNFCVSQMVDQHTQLRAYVSRDPEYYANVVIGRGAVPWRKAFEDYGKHYYGSAAKTIIDYCLNPNDRDDLEILFDTYPDHVIEFSVLDKCFGTDEHRSSLIWEVRSKY